MSSSIGKMTYWVYMLASRRGGALYTGSTSNLLQRVEQHRSGSVSAHTKRYGIHTLVWCEQHDERHLALKREHQIKHWRQDWKVALIEESNPNWRDLSVDFIS